MKELVSKLVNDIAYFDTKEFENQYCYNGELGYIYSKEKTVFRVWSPVAIKVSVNLYRFDIGENLIKSVEMESKDKGLWELNIEEDLKNIYYTYSFTFNCLQVIDKKDKINGVNYSYTIDGEEIVVEIADMNGKASGVNGMRTMIIDMQETNPDDWDKDTRVECENILDAVIYELHVRDFSSDMHSGNQYSRKYLAFTEMESHNSEGLSTGIAHLKELGITHVHLLPVQDFASIDENIVDNDSYNWGYDPYNYFIPEGSYSTNAHDGRVRIKEFKQLIKNLHDNGIGVIMDVVYNHTYSTIDSLFDNTVPNYYYRVKKDIFTDGSACGNETASEHFMFQKLMLDSLKYWITEYHIDGFRFDLMAVHDIDTMNKIRNMADEIDPNIILYGEGWNGGESKLPKQISSYKVNAYKMPRIAMFNDDGRDGVKGDVFIAKLKGFATGAMYDSKLKIEEKEKIKNSVKFMLVGSGEHPQVTTIKKVKEPTELNENGIYPWAEEPGQSINYVSAHDNLTLWDKISVSNKSENFENKVKMDKLAMAIVMLSQGIPFIHAGDEILRSKENAKCSLGYDDNSYMSSDNVNSIKWNNKTKFNDVFMYYKGLIEFRKMAKELHFSNSEDIRNRIEFIENVNENVIAYIIKEKENDDIKWFIAFNGDKNAHELDLGNDKWGIYIDGNKAGNKVLGIAYDKIEIGALSSIVLKRK